MGLGWLPPSHCPILGAGSDTHSKVLRQAGCTGRDLAGWCWVSPAAYRCCFPKPAVWFGTTELPAPTPSRCSGCHHPGLRHAEPRTLQTAPCGGTSPQAARVTGLAQAPARPSGFWQGQGEATSFVITEGCPPMPGSAGAPAPAPLITDFMCSSASGFPFPPQPSP